MTAFLVNLLIGDGEYIVYDNSNESILKYG
jgi:hypothetical protein